MEKIYSVQIQVDGFGNDTWVAFLGDSRKTCKNWVEKHFDEYIAATSWHGKRHYAIIEHHLNEEVRQFFSE